MRGTINKPHLTKNQTTSDFQFQLRSFQCQAIFAQPKFARPSLPGPSLPGPSLPSQVCPKPKFAQSQICLSPDPYLPQPKFARSHFCPSQICPDPFLPRNEFCYLSFKNRKMLLPTNFFIDLSRKKLFSLYLV